MAKLRFSPPIAILGLAVVAVLSLQILPASRPVEGLAPLLNAAEGDAEQKAADEAKHAAEEQFAAAVGEEVTQGALRFQGEKGQVVECPLKHTDVKADVSGFIARVNVTQTFHNPTQEKIEAVYVFPLPHESAVDSMTMVVGDRKIVGLINRREDARRIYEEAVAQGQTAALLEQERPNIFTQSVGNIAPDQEVKIEISYVDSLRYDMGTYEFSFPMVVGPRYIPGGAVSSPQALPKELEGKVSPPVADTNRVPDASRISPPVLAPGVRNGHDISLSVSLDAGVPVQNLTIPNHQSEVKRDGESRAQITLSSADSLPNKDFVLRYDVVGEKPALAMLTHTGKYSPDAAKLGEGYFMLMVQPQEDERLQKSPPREIVFLCDVSGSMSGQPTDKVREAMQHMLKLCREDKDTVQVITFASEAKKLFEKPVPVSKENIARALGFAQGFEGNGGTEMLKGVQLAIDEPVDKERVRIVVMLTDGYIGNEAEIIEHVGKNCGDHVRFWAIGIGSSPNMFLVDGVAKQGGGMGKQLGLEDDALALSQNVMARIQRAQLANVKIDWGKLQVAETFPARIPELWAGRPIIVYGRYQGGGTDTLSVRGEIEGEAAAWPLEVTLSEKEPQHDVLAKVWARQKIEDLMQQDFYQDSPAVEETVTALALDYKLMSQYTSFVAVDAQSATTSDAPRPPRRMLVPVPLPEGTRWEGFFGELDHPDRLAELDGLSTGTLGWAAGRFGDQAEAARYLREGIRTSTGGERSVRLRAALGVANDGRFDRRKLSTASTPFSTLAKVPYVNRLYAQPSPQAAGTQAYYFRAGAAGAAPGGSVMLGRYAGGRGGMGGGGFGFGNGAAGKSLAQGRGFVAEQLKQLADESREAAEADFDTTGLALAGADRTPQIQEAAKALEEGQKLLADGKLVEARQALLKAYFLDASAVNVGVSAGETASAALAAIEDARQRQIAGWAKELPKLEKKLDLVIRDKSLAEALETIAAAAGIDLRLVRGSLADAGELLDREELRVGFLDLRGATLAQALDWTLQPVRLQWSVADGAVRVESGRRAEASSPWVYDVSTIALPAPAELAQEQDEQKRLELARQIAEAFLQAIRGELPAEGARVEWYAPGQLLVIGEPKTHQRASESLKLLADAKAAGKLGKAAADLRATTAKRAAERKADVAKARETARRIETASTHDAYGWRLLAAAADGRLDLEALTELQIAWKSPETAKLLEAKSPGVVIRSWWAVTEAARALPGEAELQKLAGSASSLTQPAAERVLASLKENPTDGQVALTALYAALAAHDNAAFRSQVEAALHALTGEETAVARTRTVAIALLANDVVKIDTAPLIELVKAGVEGDDQVALAAFACRRAGADAWDAFRRQQRELIGRQPLSGNVVVLVNRLAGAPLPSASQVAGQ